MNATCLTIAGLSILVAGFLIWKNLRCHDARPVSKPYRLPRHTAKPTLVFL